MSTSKRIEGEKRIGNLFYEARALMGRGYSQRRFADEVLGGTVDGAVLGFIEKGQRFPTEAAVRRLAAIRGEDPQELLMLLWWERILHAFQRELESALRARITTHLRDPELAHLASKALAALPDDGNWKPLSGWRQKLRAPRRSRKKLAPVPTETANRVETALESSGLIEIRGARVRRRTFEDSAELADLISRAIAALPDDGSWRPLSDWRRKFQGEVAPSTAERVETSLIERKLIEIKGARVRRLQRDFIAENLEEKRALAVSFQSLFTKALLAKLVLPEMGAKTYLRNHYFHIDPARRDEFVHRLHEAVSLLAQEFATKEGDGTEFENVLVAATPL